MKRLVYAPRVDVYVKADSGIYDISPYVINCSVNRKVGQVSSATVTFRNPEFMWTKAQIRAQDGSLQEGPVFHPQDPIIVTMTRLFNHPVQVFTGYCDTTPYLQLFPGPCVIEASCTLKRLLYRFWDPGLPFAGQYLSSISGWVTVPGQGVMNPQAEQKQLNGTLDLTDGSIGNLLKHVLMDIGGWDEKNIFIEALPPRLGEIIIGLFNNINTEDELAKQELTQFLKQIVGTDSHGTSNLSGNADDLTITGDISKLIHDKTHKFVFDELVALWKAAKGPADIAGRMATIALAESGGPPFKYSDPQARNSSGASGLWQILGAPTGWTGSTDWFDPINNARAAVAKYNESKAAGGTGLEPWKSSEGMWLTLPTNNNPLTPRL